MRQHLCSNAMSQPEQPGTKRCAAYPHPSGETPCATIQPADASIAIDYGRMPQHVAACEGTFAVLLCIATKEEPVPLSAHDPMQDVAAPCSMRQHDVACDTEARIGSSSTTSPSRIKGCMLLLFTVILTFCPRSNAARMTGMRSRQRTIIARTAPSVSSPFPGGSGGDRPARAIE